MLSVELEPDELIKLYFYQLTNGCGLKDCSCESCVSSSKFKYLTDRTPNEKAKRAITLMLDPNHDKENQCQYMPIGLFSKSIIATIARFNDCFGELRGGKYDPRKITDITDVLFNTKLFGYMFTSPGKDLFDLDEDTLDQIPSTFQFFQSKAESDGFQVIYLFRDTMKQLINLHDTHPCPKIHVRSLLFLSLFNSYFEDDLDLINEYLKSITVFNKTENYFFHHTCTYNVIFTQHLAKISLKLLASKAKTKHIPNYLIRLITHLRDSNLLGDSVLPSSTFYSTELCNEKYINPLQEFHIFEKGDHNGLLFYPAVLTMSFKANVLSMFFKIQQEKAGKVLSLYIDRRDIIRASLNAFQGLPKQELIGELKVKFKGEDGIDAGGLRREYFFLAMTQMFSPDFGMFKNVDNRFYWFTQSSFEDPALYEVFGTIVSLVIAHNVCLPIRFPRLLYKKLLGLKVGLSDLAEINPDMHHSFTDMLQMKKNGEDVSDLMLNFTFCVDEMGQKIDLPLKDGGEDEDVTNENVEEFIQLYTNQLLNNSISYAYEPFKQGFMKLWDEKYFQILSPEELDVFVSGELRYDWEELKQGAIMEKWAPFGKQQKMFWEAFFKLTEEEKRSFLLFTTGNDRAPPCGLKEMHIKIRCMGKVKRLPEAHTCFLRCDIPAYNSTHEYVEKIRIAISNCNGFFLK